MIGHERAKERLRGLVDPLRAAEASQRERAERFRRLAARAENGTAPVAVSAWQLFPTPEDVAERMIDAADLSPGLLVLEPSAGTGNLVRAILARGADVVACEIAPKVAEQFALDFPSASLVVGDFLAQSVESLGGPFARVVMNPPFHRGDDARHILHAAEMVAPGGVLVGLCYEGRAFREELLDWCSSWERLPPNSFKEAGTRADVIMVTMRRAATV